MTWRLSESSIVRYFFNLASALESARSSTSISFKKKIGFCFSGNLVQRKSLPSVALIPSSPVPKYQCAKYFSNPLAWSTSHLPCLATLNWQMMETPILLQIFWILSKCWDDLYCEEQLLLLMMQLLGTFSTVLGISLRTCVRNVWLCSYLLLSDT